MVIKTKKRSPKTTRKIIKNIIKYYDQIVPTVYKVYTAYKENNVEEVSITEQLQVYTFVRELEKYMPKDSVAYLVSSLVAVYENETARNNSII